MQNILVNWFSGFPDWLSVVLLSALPVTELRVSLPLALYYYDLSIWQSIFFTLIGNSLPVAIMFIFFTPFLHWAERHSPTLHRFIHLHLRRLQQTHQKQYQRYGAFFLFIFVAVPLPGSGVWTGSLLAILFGMKPKFSIPAILFGMLAACVIVLLLSLYAGTF